jgi:hypothetical protein
MQLCSSDVVCYFLRIAKMQQHDSAQETDLHFAASPFEALRPSMSLNQVFLPAVSNLYQGAQKKVPLSNQGTVQQLESTILLSMTFLLDLAVDVFGERSKFLSYKTLSFSSNP